MSQLLRWHRPGRQHEAGGGAAAVRRPLHPRPSLAAGWEKHIREEQVSQKTKVMALVLVKTFFPPTSILKTVSVLPSEQ